MAYYFDVSGGDTKWIKHYSSSQKILLVGEGNFSFAACLAQAFGSGHNMTATSLSSECELLVNHRSARENMNKLRELGCTILHQVDATTMCHDHRLWLRSFDRIVYNFPHAGFTFKENNMIQIMLHKEVVKGFLRNARELLSLFGEVHVTHKTKHPFSAWKIVELAKEVGLYLVEEADFSIYDYPGYQNKRGSGNRSDETFIVGQCSNFKFANGL